MKCHVAVSMTFLCTLKKAHYSTGRVAIGFTSTVIVPQTVNEAGWNGHSHCMSHHKLSSLYSNH